MANILPKPLFLRQNYKEYTSKKANSEAFLLQYTD